MDRRTFFGALAALPVAATVEPKPARPLWVNYTTTYASVDKAEVIERMRRAIAAHERECADLLESRLWG